MLRLGRCMGLCVAQAIWGLMRSLVVSLPGTLLASRRSAEGLWRSRRELGGTGELRAAAPGSYKVCSLDCASQSLLFWCVEVIWEGGRCHRKLRVSLQPCRFSPVQRIQNPASPGWVEKRKLH